jgi:predicted RNA-binding protein YlqC (UPF0109 family)
MKEFVEFIVKHLVDKEEEVKVTEVTGEHTNIYEVRVSKEDFGKIIGKRGAHAQAIRWLLNAASKKTGKGAMLEILE